MSTDELLKEQNELFRVLIRLFLDQELSSTEDKAKFLNQFNFTHKEIGEILDRKRNTITGYLGDE